MAVESVSRCVRMYLRSKYLQDNSSSDTRVLVASSCCTDRQEATWLLASSSCKHMSGQVLARTWLVPSSSGRHL
jgi:hypothetical protein